MFVICKDGLSSREDTSTRSSKEPSSDSLGPGVAVLHATLPQSPMTQFHTIVHLYDLIETALRLDIPVVTLNNSPSTRYPQQLVERHTVLCSSQASHRMPYIGRSTLVASRVLQTKVVIEVFVAA